MRGRLLVLFGSSYSFRDDTSGRLVEGLSVHYQTEGAPRGENVMGSPIITANLDYTESSTVLKGGPGYYDCDFQQIVAKVKKAGSGYEQVLTPVNLRFVAPLAWPVIYPEASSAAASLPLGGQGGLSDRGSQSGESGIGSGEDISPDSNASPAARRLALSRQGGNPPVVSGSSSAPGSGS